MGDKSYEEMATARKGQLTKAKVNKEKEKRNER